MQHLFAILNPDTISGLSEKKNTYILVLCLKNIAHNKIHFMSIIFKEQTSFKIVEDTFLKEETLRSGAK